MSSNQRLNFFTEFLLEDEDDSFALINSCLKKSSLKPILLNADGSGRKRNRMDYTRTKKLPKSPDPWQQVKWLQLISDPTVNDPTSRSGKDFRKKFRVPYPLFVKMVQMCKETDDPLFNYSTTDAAGAKSIPLELKILAVLRTLGGGLKFNDASEMSGYMSMSSLNSFFKKFNARFRIHFEESFIRPLENVELQRSMKTYAMLGLPGCIGSMDATFVPWEKTSSHLSNVCDGDKGKGLLYNVIVTHCKEVIAAEGSFYATINDKNSVKYSQFISRLMNKTIYKDLSYRVLTGLGDEDIIEMSNPYVIVDGGYIDTEFFMSGFGVSSNPVKYKFTDWVASVRKDVECFFAILKNRFRFFKNPITLQSQKDIDNAFITACIIHNMILREDGLNVLWESSVNWHTLDPNGAEDTDTELNTDEALYEVTIHDNDLFVPTTVDDCILQEDVRFYSHETQKFETL